MFLDFIPMPMLEQADDLGGSDGDTAEAGEKTFTQEEVNKIVGDRLAREKGKYTDYEDLKGIVEEVTKLGYTGTPSEIRKAIQAQADAYLKQKQLEELENEAETFGTTPELTKEIKSIKDELSKTKEKLAKYEEKEEAKTKEQLEKEAIDKKIQEEFDDFEDKHKEVDLNKLLKDEDFKDFLDTVNPNLTLTQKYEKYIKLMQKANAAEYEKIQSKLARSTSSGRGDGKTESYGLTEAQIKLCKEAGIDPKKYAQRLKQIQD